MIDFNKFKQQVNLVENHTLELKRMLEQEEVYNSNISFYNAISEMISNVLSQTSSIRKTVKNSDNKRLLKG